MFCKLKATSLFLLFSFFTSNLLHLNQKKIPRLELPGDLGIELYKLIYILVFRQ